MGSIYLFSQKIGRINTGTRALTFAAVLMLLLNPLLLLSDIGFQLSFLATLGILVLAPKFKQKLQKIPNPDYVPIRELLSMTLAAQIFTSPILIYNFGEISLIATVSNILIVPILPLIMMFGLAFIMLGSIFHIFAFILSFPLYILLTYTTTIVNIFSHFPVITF